MFKSLQGALRRKELSLTQGTQETDAIAYVLKEYRDFLTSFEYQPKTRILTLSACTKIHAQELQLNKPSLIKAFKEKGIALEAVVIR